MNLPCLCFVDELLDQEEIETDVPKATSRHVRAGHGQRAAVWEWELLAAAEPVQNWPKVTLVALNGCRVGSTSKCGAGTSAPTNTAPTTPRPRPSRPRLGRRRRLFIKSACPG